MLYQLTPCHIALAAIQHCKFNTIARLIKRQCVRTEIIIRKELSFELKSNILTVSSAETAHKT